MSADDSGTFCETKMSSGFMNASGVNGMNQTTTAPTTPAVASAASSMMSTDAEMEPVGILDTNNIIMFNGSQTPANTQSQQQQQQQFHHAQSPQMQQLQQPSTPQQIQQQPSQMQTQQQQQQQALDNRYSIEHPLGIKFFLTSMEGQFIINNNS